ncbi:MAG: hypothetical protein JNM14_09085 [Ferruginibacter sp.]|nr:hypothetical protein [Ferruginibacter sp.]
MEDNTGSKDKSRRWFLSLFAGTNKKAADADMVKMLTADGKLVQVDRAVLEAASKKQKSANREIYDWMQNPSKENNS